MPKGVEHYGAQQEEGAAMTVPRPLMPKGVEHYFPGEGEAIRRGAETSDAERR